MANEITQPVLDALVGTVSRGMMDSKLERPPLDRQEPDQERVDTLASMVAHYLVANEDLLRRLYNEPELVRGAIYAVGRALVAELLAQEVGAQPLPKT